MSPPRSSFAGRFIVVAD